MQSVICFINNVVNYVSWLTFTPSDKWGNYKRYNLELNYYLETK